MAKVTPSDLAPKGEDIRYLVAGAEFVLGPDTDPFVTDDPDLIASIETNEWLHVEYDAPAAAPDETNPELAKVIPFGEDHMTLAGSIAFNDPEVIEAAEAEKALVAGDVPAEVEPPVTAPPAAVVPDPETAPEVAPDPVPAPAAPETSPPVVAPADTTPTKGS